MNNLDGLTVYPPIYYIYFLLFLFNNILSYLTIYSIFSTISIGFFRQTVRLVDYQYFNRQKSVIKKRPTVRLADLQIVICQRTKNVVRYAEGLGNMYV
jgi:hypothetical protein